jgi:hypothetical protein
VDNRHSFFTNLQSLESFADVDADTDAYIDNIGSNSRLINE